MSWILWLGLVLAQPAPPPIPGPPPPAHELADVLDHRDELMTLLERHDPRQHARMVRLEHTDPQAFALGLLRVAKMLERLRDDPEAAERFRQIREETERLETLARDFGQLSAADQKRRRAEMEAGARRLMELKQAERRARVEELRARIAELEADIEAREKDADKLVDTYVDQLLQAPVDL
jgi:signal transduction histidine kinase